MTDWKDKDMQNLIISSNEIDSHMEPQKDASLKSARSFLGSTKKLIKNEGDENSYYQLPFNSLWGKVNLRRGKISLIGGGNGAKKSMITGQIMLHLAKLGAKSCIGNFEMTPEETFERLAYQAIGNQTPTDNMITEFFMWLCWEEKIMIFDQLDIISTDRVLNLVDYCGHVLKMDFIVIDSLMMMDIDPKDTGRQKSFGLKLSASCKSSGIHVFLVAHCRKPPVENNSGKTRQPNRYDILGASELSNIANNIFMCWENPSKVAQLVKPPAQRDMDWEKMPDHYWRTEKQRGGKFEGNTPLWFDDRSLQMLDSKHARAYEYWKHFKEGLK